MDSYVWKLFVKYTCFNGTSTGQIPVHINFNISEEIFGFFVCFLILFSVSDTMFSVL